jgi:HEAT repeat protein
LALAGCSRSSAYWAEELRSADARERLHAVHALQTRAADREASIPLLVDALQDQNPYVRRDAARALAQLGAASGAAEPALRRLLHDPQPGVRKAAAQALGVAAPRATASR